MFPVGPQHLKGRAFCRLPLPVETGLPLSFNRRDICYGDDMSGDGRLRSQWNKLLLEGWITPIPHPPSSKIIHHPPLYQSSLPRVSPPLSLTLLSLPPYPFPPPPPFLPPIPLPGSHRRSGSLAR
jgi:hypothetical protein